MKRNKIQSTVARASKDIEINLARKHHHLHNSLAGDQRESLIQNSRNKNSLITEEEGIAATMPLSPQQQAEAAQNTTNGRQAPLKKSNAAIDFKDSSNSDISPKESSRGRGLFYLCLTLMGLLLFVTAILVAIYSFVLLDNEDVCYNPNSPQFHQTGTGYNLFATKTSYSAALSCLTGAALVSTPQLSPQLLVPPPVQPRKRPNYDELPKIFSQRKEDSLENIHKRLISEGCNIRQLHYYGRHAARYPSRKEIERIEQDMSAIQRRLNNPPSESNVAPPAKQQVGGESSRPHSSAAETPTANKSDVCLDPILPFKQWKFQLSPSHDDLITPVGFNETEAIARRFKSLYPQLFNATASKIELGVTGKLRTAQTLLAFMKHLDNFDNQVCKLSDFPKIGAAKEDTEKKLKAIQADTCFNGLTSKYKNDKLDFHNECKKYHKREQVIYDFGLRDSKRTQSIAESISKRLKLSKTSQLDVNETKAIYDTCRYESAFDSSRSSIWCNLFEEKELKFYEYLNDIGDFYNDAYGETQHFREACPITTDIMRRMMDEQQKKQSTAGGQLESNFYFTHSSVIQKLIAASVDLSRDSAYSEKSVMENLGRGSVPKERLWQTSLLSPFSANIAFSLYECPVKSQQLPNELNTEFVGPHKVIASLNEQPIVLGGCDSLVCDLKKLMYRGRMNIQKDCPLDEICSSFQFIVT